MTMMNYSENSNFISKKVVSVKFSIFLQRIESILLKREKTIILCIFILAILTRLKYAWPSLIGLQGFGWGDDEEYFSVAMSILENGTLVMTSSVIGPGYVAWRMPLFPMVLAVIYKVFGSDPSYAFPFLILIGASTCLGTYYLGKSVFNPFVGVVGAFLTAIDLGLVYYNGFLLSETLFVFLFVICLICVERLKTSHAWYWPFITGIFLGLTNLTRVNFILIVPVVIMWNVYIHRSDLKLALKKSIIIASIVALTWGGWIIRNLIVLGEFVPFTTQGGYGYIGIYNDLAIQDKSLILYGHWKHIPLPEFAENWSELEKERFQRGEAVEWIKSNPELAVGVALMQAVHLWQPEFGGNYLLIHPLLLLIGCIGSARAIKSGNLSVTLWVLIAVIMTATAILTIAVSRFQLLMHPAINLLISYALFTSMQRIGMNAR